VADESGPSLNVRIDEGGRTMQFGIIKDGQLAAGIQVTAEELDRIIGGLAQIRSQMSPPVPETLFPERTTNYAEATHYDVILNPAAPDEVILSLRNPGLGWLSFGIPLGRIEEIAHQGREVRARVGTPHPPA
jgi:hypothetical protein